MPREGKKFFRSISFVWIVIVVTLLVFSGWYFRYRGQAGTTVNTSKETVMTSNLVGHWTFDGDNVVWDDTSSEIKDSTAYANHGNAIGLTRTSVIAGVTGQGMNFNGTSDYVNISESSGLPVYTSNTSLSIAFWVKALPTGTGISENTLFSEGPVASASFPHFRLEDIGNSELHVKLRNNGGGTDIDLSSTSDVFDGTWHHVVWADNNGSAVLYVDGVQDATNFSYTRSTMSSITQTGIGYQPEWSGLYFSGNIDDVRIYNTALTATQVADLYRATGAKEISNANHREALTSGLVGYWTFDGRDIDWGDTGTEVKDISGNLNHGAVSGLTRTSVTPGKLGQGMSFDGTSDYVHTAVSIDQSLTGSGATFAAWVYPFICDATTRSIVSQSNGGYDWMLYLLSCYPGLQVDGNLSNNSSFSIDMNQWSHVVGVFDADSDRTIVYINGVGEDVGALANSGGHTTIDIARSPIGTQYFSGYLDDIRIYSFALTATQVVDLYRTGY